MYVGRQLFNHYPTEQWDDSILGEHERREGFNDLFGHMPLTLKSAGWDPLLYRVEVTAHAFREDDILVDDGGLHGGAGTLQPEKKTKTKVNTFPWRLNGRRRR